MRQKRRRKVVWQVSFFAAAVLCFTALTVHSAEFTEVEIKNNILSGEVEISGRGDDVYNIGFCVTDANVSSMSYTEKIMETRTYAIGQTASDLSGRFSCRLKMPESLITGTYRVFIYADDRKGIYRDFAYSDYQAANVRFEYLNTESDSNKLNSYFLTNIAALKNEMLFDDYFYNEFVESQRKKAAEMFLVARPARGFQTLEQMRGCFHTICLSIACSEEHDVARSDRYLRERGSLYGDVTLYVSVEEEVRRAVCGKLTGAYLEPERFFEFIESESVVQSFKCAAVWNKYPDLMERFSGYFPLTEPQRQQAARLTNTERNELYMNMYSSRARYESCGEILAVYIAEIERLSGQQTSSGGAPNENKGGGSFSGGGHSSSVADFAVTGDVTAGYLPSENNNVQQGGTDIFHDINDAFWAKDYIFDLYSKNIVSGFEDGCFYPNNNVTREEFVKMAALSFHLQNGTPVPFDDVPEDAWYRDYIALAYGERLVLGVDENRFGVGEYLTREDLAVIVYRAMRSRDMAFGENQIHFLDEADISPYAKESVLDMCSLGIISGMPDGTFCPREFATRAQTAKILSAVLSMISQ